MFLLIFLLPLQPIASLQFYTSVRFSFFTASASSHLLLSHDFCCFSYSLCLFSFCLTIHDHQLHTFSLYVTVIFLKRKNLRGSAKHICMVYSDSAVLFAGPPPKFLKRRQIHCFGSRRCSWFTHAPVVKGD